eukprot:SAG31_NODE_135_length_23206_cov_25.707967_6_plen_295_part_00
MLAGKCCVLICLSAANIVLLAGAHEHHQQCASLTAAEVARTAHQMCGEMPIEGGLRSVGLGITAVQAAEMLEQLGFRRLLDLRLIVDHSDAEDLMSELKSNGLPTGDRAKIRLLIGDRCAWKGNFDLVCRASSMISCWPGLRRAHLTSSETTHSSAPRGFAPTQPAGLAEIHPRQLQDQDSGGLSMDTLAIVFSVLVGAAGYLVQAYTARRAQEANAIQARQAQHAEQTREREHEQLLSQIQRSGRWLEYVPTHGCGSVLPPFMKSLTITFVTASAAGLSPMHYSTCSRLGWLL